MKVEHKTVKCLRFLSTTQLWWSVEQKSTDLVNYSQVLSELWPKQIPPGGVVQMLCFLCHLARYHQQCLTSRGTVGWKFGLVLIAGKMLCKWPVLGRKTTATIPQHEAAFFVNQLSFICWSKPWWACDGRLSKKDWVSFQRVLWKKLEFSANSLSLTKKVKLSSG